METGSREVSVEREFNQWVVEHGPALRRLVAARNGTDGAADVVQDALARAWEKLHTYDPTRGTPQAWLLAIGADQARQARRRPRLYVLGADEAETDALDLDAALDLRRAVNRLPRRQRAAIVLYYYADLSVAEVSRVLKCAEGTVKSNLSDARKTLGRALGAIDNGRG